jgi:branched-chain amino acid transport system ATP-binding protein
MGLNISLSGGTTAKPKIPVRRAAELTTENIEVRFGGLTALAGIDMTVTQGEIFGLIGPNGAGKTTLVNCMTGFQKPTTGRVRLNGADMTGRRPERIRKAGVARTFQAGRLFRDMTVLDNVEATAVGMGLTRRRAAIAAMDVLEWLGIADKAKVTAGALPYTDERRVGIARALVLDPTFVLLDEPAAGMSDAECDDLVALISAIPEDFGCGVVLIDHNMRVVMGVSHRIHVLQGGRTIAEGSPQEIQRNKTVLAAYLGSSRPSSSCSG